MPTPESASPVASLTCSVCSRSSTWHAAFTEVRDGTIKRLCCPRCAANWHAKWGRRRLVLFALCAVLALIVLLKGRARGPDLVVVLWILYLLVYYPLVILHEAGHALAARLVGTSPFAIVVGRKPWVLDRDFFGLRWRVGRHPAGGVTYHAPCEGPAASARSALIAAAGPLMNLLIATITLSVAANLPGRFDHSLTTLALLVTGVVSALHFLLNLWPREANTVAGKIPSDGARILNLLRGKVDEPRSARGMGHYFRASFAFDDREFATAANEAALARASLTDPRFAPAIAVLEAAARSESDDARGAVHLLRPLHEGTIDDPGLRAGAADNLAWAYLLLDEPQMHETAIQLVAEACAIAPWEESYLISLACLFAVSATSGNGRADDARALLGTLRLPELTRQNAAYAPLALGLCAAAEGDAAAARKQYDDAKSRGATAAPLRLLERRIASI